MCIIAVKPADRPMFPDQTIRTMFENNSHGAGLMYRKTDGKVHIEKGFFNVSDMLDYVHAKADELSDKDVVVHFRIATSGKKDMLGCHPYPVWSKNKSASCDVPLAMVHNGILDGYGYKGNDEINDTQIFIKECLRKLPHNFLHNQAICDMISKMITSSYQNRLCFLDKEGFHLLGGKFIEDDGYWYSNDSYKPRYSLFSTKKSEPVKTQPKPAVNVKPTARELQNYLFHLFEEDDLVRFKKKDFKELENVLKLNFRHLDSSSSDSDVRYYYDDCYVYVVDSKTSCVERYRLNDDARRSNDYYDIEEDDDDWYYGMSTDPDTDPLF
ncbi:MAG: hypothetical protein Q4D71_14655 [Oscillospiraceae bacterium]|nr:hypothetical protein [Oscillospiraceae bacterium]